MNDLKNGILDINGFLIGPNTTIEALESQFGIKAKSYTEYQEHFDFDEQTFLNSGIEFTADISFKGKIVEIELFPQFPEIEAKYGINRKWHSSGDRDKDLAYYKELRAILDEWLEKQLGAPHESDDHGVSYKFGTTLIFTAAYIDERSRDFDVIGGALEIHYGVGAYE